MTSQQRLAELKRKAELVKEGKNTFIPFKYHFPNISNHVPGIYKGAMIKILAGTNVGKTRFTKFCTILIPYYLSKEIDLKYKTIYFALEESKDQFIDNLFIYMIKLKFNVDTDYLTLNSYREGGVSEELFNMMGQVSEEVDEILNNIYIIDDLFTPSACYMKCKEIAKELGDYKEDTNGFVSYTPHNPDEFVLVVMDHISLLQGEVDQVTKQYNNSRESMDKWSSVYCLKYLTRRFDWCVWNVQQTTMTSEGFERKKTNTLEPGYEDAGENKTILRNDHIILTLFSPYESKIPNYNGYRISDRNRGLKYKFINLGVLKNRFGRKGLNQGLLFNGAAGTYEELDLEAQEEFYV